MSNLREMWRALLSGLPQPLIDALRMEKVVVSRDGESMMICLLSDGLIEEQQFAQIRAKLRAGFPGFSVALRIASPSLQDAFLKDPAPYLPFLSRKLLKFSPGASAFLSDVVCELVEGALNIYVSSRAGADYFGHMSLDRRLEALLFDVFRLRLPVKVLPKEDQGRVQRFLEEREQQEQQLSQKIVETQAKARPAEKRISQLLGNPIADHPIPMSELTQDEGRFVLRGEVISSSTRPIRDGASLLLSFTLSDRTSTIYCKAFLRKETGESAGQEGGYRKGRSALPAAQIDAIVQTVVPGTWLIVRGDYRQDDFLKDMALTVNDMRVETPPMRTDDAPEKRVELHLHTQMSNMDGMSSAEKLIKRAKAWGHPAIAVTDHGVLQAFPEAFKEAGKAKIKLIPGCEGYLIEDSAQIVENADERALTGSVYVVLDFETTGLSASQDSIVEIGAVRIEDGVETAAFEQLVNPRRAMPPKATEINGITDAMLRDMPTMDAVIDSFEKFIEGAVIVAHNAPFDAGFLRHALQAHGGRLENPVLDTLALARYLLPAQKSYKLGTLTKQFNIPLDKAHRAVHDARATSQLLLRLLALAGEKHGAEQLSDLNGMFLADGRGESFHIILLAQNQQGMRNLNYLVSEAHLRHFHKRPHIPRSLLMKHREGLILGSACEAGELMRAILRRKDDGALERIASFYDYLEIQPIGNNEFLVRDGSITDDEGLRDLNRRVVALGEKLNKPVVATGDVHFLDPDDAVYRAILMTGSGFDDADQQAPLYFKTTQEMLEEFSYLGAQKAKEVVVDNPNAIAARVSGNIRLFREHPEGKETFQPEIDEAAEVIERRARDRAFELYGAPMPAIVSERLEKELKAIIGYGFATLYYIACKLVERSLMDGYIVGSRGSVGSSLVAYLVGITEVNALPPHYVCPKCKFSDFEDVSTATCMLDLRDRDCPRCGARMSKSGFDIPFEVFLGFKGDKVPDIDLNFSGEYQATAHAFLETMFGRENVFRAGTIGTLADKTAFGFVTKYLEKHERRASRAEIDRLVAGCVGVKRSTGQHPGGMVILPKQYEIYEFTAIQRPADDVESQTVTTHYDFTSMHDVLVKLDVLGHDDPTMLRKLQLLTGVKPHEVPLSDDEAIGQILSLFRSPEALGVSSEQIDCKSGTLGIPEFGTRFVRQMLLDTMPTTMEELLRISGLSHGTNVWLGNAQDLVRNGTATLKECICTRDDIMNALIKLGEAPKMAFDTMESVRKGKGLTEAMESAMRAVDVPEWFVDSCKKIEYMFPKGHAVAYVMSALRIAYFKIRYPQAYYIAFLTRNAHAFDALTMLGDIAALKEQLCWIEDKGKEASAKEERAMTLLESLIEMNARGIRLRAVDLLQSAATEFTACGEDIMPPFTALPGLGESAAKGIVEARGQGAFISVEDLVRRAHASRAVVDILREGGALRDLPDTSQVSLFDFSGI